MIVILTFIIVFMLVGLGLFVALSRASESIKISFQILCLSLAVWIVSNTFADVMQSASLFWTRLAFASAALAVAGLAVFTIWFPRKVASHSSHLSVALLLLSLAVAMFSMSDAVVPSIKFENNYADVVPGSLYNAYVTYVLTMVIMSIIVLIFKLRRAVGDESQRVRYVLVGMTLTAVFVLTTNLLLPLVMGNNPLAIYGSFGILFLIALVAYAIVRHSLFSIKVATARAVAYILSGVTLALLFGVIIFVSNRALFSDDTALDLQQMFYILSAVSIGFVFPVIQRFFNTLTKRILLRDYYDPEVVLTNIAKIISTERTSRSVLNKVTHEINDTLQLSFVEAYVREDEGWKRKAAAGYHGANRVINVDEILKAKNSVIVPLFKAEVGSDLSEEVSLIIALRTTQELVGYLLLGYKQNGVGFSKSDYSMLEAIANETAIATENNLRFEEIKELNESLQARVNEATKELRVSNKKLQELDKSKDEFISMASHQLRTPLTAVKGYISMMLEGDIGKVSTQQREVLEQAYDSSQRMVFLIGDFLNVSRLQTGKFVIEPNPINYTELVVEEVDQLKDTARARKITLNYEKPDSAIMGVADENKLRQVMMNFIDNAIFYSPAGTSVDVQLYRDEKGIVFKVNDHGIGVPKAEQAKLFTKFFRAGNARQQRPDGTGIGIYMAKKVIAAHGGTIIFESKEGVGSTFGFTLPLEYDAKQLDK